MIPSGDAPPQSKKLPVPNPPPIRHSRPSRCLNWRRTSGMNGAALFPPCHRPWCPCLLQDSEVTHGLSERRRLFHRWRDRFPDRAGFLTWVVHVHSQLHGSEITRLVGVVRYATRGIDPHAVIWAFIHWREVRGISGPIQLPHLHVGVWSDDSDALVRRESAHELSRTVCERGARVRLQRGPGRPARDSIGDDPRIIRVDARELRNGGEAGQWLHYVMRCKVDQDRTAVPPPRGQRWFYGPRKAKRVVIGTRRKTARSGQSTDGKR